MAKTTKVLGILPVNRGTYEGSKSYYKNNIVYLNGSSYICKVDGPISNVSPETDTNNTNWDLFAGGGARTMDVANIDFSAAELLAISNATAPAYYLVKEGEASVGTLLMFSDDMRHMVTQVFFTNYNLTEEGALNTSSHSDVRSFIYTRRYHQIQGSTEQPVSTWSKWTDFLEHKQDKLTPGTGISIVDTVDLETGKPITSINCTLDTTLFIVVTELPTEEIKEDKIYLKLSSEGGEEGNTYDEYIYRNGAWELLGQYKTEVDLTGYTKYVGDFDPTGNTKYYKNNVLCYAGKVYLCIADGDGAGTINNPVDTRNWKQIGVMNTKTINGISLWHDSGLESNDIVFSLNSETGKLEIAYDDYVNPAG